MFKKIWERIKDALQSPPGKFILALCGGFAVGSLAYKAISSKDRKRIAGRNSSINTDDTRDAINDIQRQQREDISDSIDSIEEIVADIGRGIRNH